ncbi:MAG: permease, partial [Pseudomonas sagittaria]|nr:permease [Pseudomonas sagittaria]
MEIFRWLNDQLLRMDWLAYLVRLLVEDVFGLDMASRIGGSLHFFIYDVIKIFILLSVLIFAISWVQSYFPPERTRRILAGMQGFRANVMGALLGTVTPFCSCSSIPLFIGFTSSGLPLAVTFSFLISSPLVDLASMVLLASIFNWSIALAYVAVGIVLAVLGGALIGQARMERYVEAFVTQHKVLDLPQEQLSLRDRLGYARKQVTEIIRKVWLYILIGVGIGAAIHNWIPADLITALIGRDHWWSVP